ncbi:hypothetical protein TanjilG_10115 [Lupinus angustifolius]|uniref:Glabrous enhancer-binding protein-like DBD domain-containing protein n=1 Tax=Lupinus angustifolius TaxID=3871 RepID=A0A1J7H325_LUPAN|nr:PREDICTED: probable transcription factor At5g28040 [Lupinus angustifolius]OIW07142.1 hypothetical protein TanjilG_10115 [Lupinus angustifolius]
MLSQLVSWIFSSTSSSSSSSEEYSIEINTNELNHENNNVIANEDNNHNDHVVDQNQNNNHCISSCNVDDEAIPVALAIPNASPDVTVAFPNIDERNIVIAATTTTMVTHPKRQRVERITSYSSLGKQHQRLWTKQDETELLKGYLDYIRNHRKGTTTLQNDVALLYDHVKPKLNVDFNKNQLVAKLRRLKRKHKVSIDKIYNSASGSSTFKNLQDKAIFEISHKIWGNDKDQDGVFESNGSTPVTENHDLDNGNIEKEKIEQVENNCDEIDNKVSKKLRLCNEDNNGDNKV